MKEAPRETFILEQGQFDQPGEKVEPRTPEALPAFDGYPATRLGLAQWLTAQHGLLEVPLREAPDQRIAWSPGVGAAAAAVWLIAAPLGLAATGLWVRARRRRG